MPHTDKLRPVIESSQRHMHNPNCKGFGYVVVRTTTEALAYLLSKSQKGCETLAPHQEGSFIKLFFYTRRDCQACAEEAGMEARRHLLRRRPLDLLPMRSIVREFRGE